MINTVSKIDMSRDFFTLPLKNMKSTVSSDHPGVHLDDFLSFKLVYYLLGRMCIVGIKCIILRLKLAYLNAGLPLFKCAYRLF